MEENVKKAIESYLEGFLHGLMNKYDSKVVKDEILKKLSLMKKKASINHFMQLLYLLSF